MITILTLTSQIVQTILILSHINNHHKEFLRVDYVYCVILKCSKEICV